jgi:DNA processing protein
MVVEASWRSGSLTTLKWGELLSRACLAVPGPVTSEASAGVHLALREHRAELVTNAAEVRDALAPLGAAPVDGVGTVGLGRTRATDLLDPRELEVLEALPAGAAGLTPEQLSARTRLPIAAVRHSLVSLAERSLAEGGPQGWRLAARRA